MLEKKVIFILSLMKFDGLPSTNFTVAKYLAKRNEVYYIEHPYTVKDYFKADRKNEKYLIRKKSFNFFSNGLLEQKIDGVNLLISSPIFSINFLPKGLIYNFLSRINEKIILRRIKRIIKEKKISNYIYINFYALHFPLLANSLQPDLKIYYCVDPIPDYDRKHGVTDELALMKNSDLIICTSKALYEEKKRINSNCYFVPNASDLVNQIQFGELKQHPLLAGIARPVIGYIGAIERRINYGLLQEVASQNPALHFVLVGPRNDDYIPPHFLSQENVHFINAIPPAEVPDMINGFDICLIPFKKDDISSSIFPLKLFEYLGMGKPVIVTDFNDDLKEYVKDGIVKYVHNANEFNSALNSLLFNSSELLVQSRIEVAKQNTWQERMNRVAEIIIGFLKQ